MIDRPFYVGQQLLFYRPQRDYEGVQLVTVTRLHKRGAAMLSNGWLVDSDGHAEGTRRIPGGYVCGLPHEQRKDAWQVTEAGETYAALRSAE